MTSGLHKAVLEGRYQQVKFYIESGLRIGKHGGNEENVLLAALHLEHEGKRRQIFNYLLHRGANYWDVDAETGRDGLLWACYMDRTAQVQKLIKFAVGNLNFATKDHEGKCNLHFAVKHGNIDLLRILLTNYQKYGLSVDIPDNEGLTPLLHAKTLGYDEIVRILIEEGSASTYRADDKTLKSADDWKFAGKLIRNLEHHQQKENKRIYGKKLAINVLPQIDPRGLYRTKTTLWNRSQTKHVTIHPALQQKSYSLPANYRRNSIDKLRSILKYRPDEKAIVLDSCESPDKELRALIDSPLSSPRKVNEKAATASIGQIMALLSDQICDSYRDPAVDKIKETLERSKKSRRMTTLARITNRVKTKADEQEKRVKLKKELERQTKLLKKKGDSFLKESEVKRDGLSVNGAKSREPSKVGLLPPIKNS